MYNIQIETFYIHHEYKRAGNVHYLITLMYMHNSIRRVIARGS